MSNFYCHSTCWALFLLVSHVATQQVPLFNVATLGTTNETFRSNFCELHRQIDSGAIQLRYALKNVKLRPALFRYQLDSKTGRIAEVNPPIAIQILDEIARRAQFEWRDSYGVIDSPDGNQTWGEVLSWSIDTYDLNGEWYLRTTERLADNILFPEYWYDGSLILVKKTVEVGGAFPWNAVFDPFTYGVWLLVLATAFITSISYYAIDYIGRDGDINKMEVSIRESLYQSLLSLTGHYNLDPKQVGNRMIALSTYFFSLIIIATYTANLASFLVVRNTPAAVINNMQDVIKNDMSVCVLRGATSETFMRERYNTVRLVGKESILDTYLGVDSGDCDMVLTTTGTWDTKKGDIVYNEDCQKEWVGRHVQFIDAGFSLRDSSKLCSSLVRDVFSLHLLEMKLDKTYESIWNTHIANSETNNCQDIEASEDGSDLASLSVKNVGGIFIVHLIALVVSFAITMYNSFQRKRQVELAGTPAHHSRLHTHDSSLESAGSTISQDLSEDNDLPVARTNSLQMEKQMECMESMRKQMEVMQVQLAKLVEAKTE